MWGEGWLAISYWWEMEFQRSVVTVFSVSCFNDCHFVVARGCRRWESDQPVVEGDIGGCICGCVWVSDMREGCGATELLKGEIV